ncbi:MAG: CotH kinase family protein [Anaerolineaceae bacterium]|nr:CotH kinase family protein [Anaerolineaceae bacterium]
MFKKLLYLLVILSTLLAMSGCSNLTQPDSQTSANSTDSESTDTGTTHPEGWAETSHGDDVDPDYETVFPQDEVNRIDIIISEENWDAMLADMTSLYGEFGKSSGTANRPAGDRQNGAQVNPQNQPNQVPGHTQDAGADPTLPQNSPEDAQMPNAGGGVPAGMLTADSTNPIWVTATISFEGETWDYVGIRFKGNSSLKTAWSSGNLKLPFKLDFDQFEDEYPEINNQRFFGFKQLTLSSNFNDNSYLREKVTADIFRDFGVPAAHTAFYEVYVDTGEGPVYFGLYTLVEAVEDTVISEQFASDEGNLYKPEGSGATFAEGSFDEAAFDKETNQDEDDYADIEALFAVLHAETRLTDPTSWRKALEAVFDVDTFLRWLAVNTVIQNWDTYGNMSHNYFLYTDPEDSLITWIPWDNNHALDGSGKSKALSLSLDEVTDEWPLIRYLMDDPLYQNQYKIYVSAVVNTVFVPDEMAQTYQYYHDLINASALAETDNATMLTSKEAFENSVEELINQVNSRYDAVQAFLQN